MARKRSQLNNGLDSRSSSHRNVAFDTRSRLPKGKGKGDMTDTKVISGEELPNGNLSSMPLKETMSNTHQGEDEKKTKGKSGKTLRREKPSISETEVEGQPVPCVNDMGECNSGAVKDEAPKSKDGNETFTYGSNSPNYLNGGSPQSLDGWGRDGNVVFSLTAVLGCLNKVALSFTKASTEWVEKSKPLFINLTTKILNTRDYVRVKVRQGYPIAFRWISHLGNIMLLLSMVWLDCTLRGIDSFLRMGTASIFSVIWWSFLSMIAMTGIFKFVLILAGLAVLGFFVGFTLTILGTTGAVIAFLWFYGRLWTALLIILFGGGAFMSSHERFALFIVTAYSVYCAWSYVGWLGFILGLNLSFISNDALIFFLRNNTSEQGRPGNPPEETAGSQGQQGFFSGEPMHASPAEGSGLAADRSTGAPSTSGSDYEMTSEDEVVRLLNCTDHYSALGLLRFQNVDVSVLKREYRKKAMLVHPDKNMGNERAAEAFKKLQNAYEVLLDSFKRKAYDDELRREELLNYLRKFQNASQKSRGNKFFNTGFGCMEADGDLLESRRIACRKCGSYHVWICTKKSKSNGRWCQDCNDFHQSKDGDGWVEQSSQSLLFGLLHKVDAPVAYVCANGKIYNATEWYLCQGMRCPVNTHKPSFHVNTSVTFKHGGNKRTGSGQRGIPTTNMEESMTEEEFVEWLQNAVHSGLFDDFATRTTESPATETGSTTKNGSNNSSSGSSKRKKKGKKQW